MGVRIVAESEYLSTKPVIVVIPTAAAHIRELSETLREADRKEIEGYGFSGAKGLWKSYKAGLRNRTALVDGKVAAIWGCAGTYMGSVGQPWLMTSHEVKKVSPLKFARIYQKEVMEMLKLFPRLVNYVANDYAEAVRLLDIVGFELGKPFPLAKTGMLYRKFEMRA